jgi:prolyl-tRNA editing enzyme YbaK/EbsC (Cys-tRNA(Pro) deacylase)
MGVALPPSAERVSQALAAAGLEAEVKVLEASTRSAAEAAAAIGCTVAQIAKSLVFRTRETGRPVLVVASGTNRVDEEAVAALVGETLAKADAAFVRDRTGFAIGGVAPVGHREPPVTVIDEDLLAFDSIWAAAGTPNAVFRLTPSDLVRITGGRVAAIATSFPPPPAA